MEIKQLQNKICEAIKQRLAKSNIEPSIDLTLIHLIEELGELYRQRANEKMKRGSIDKENLGQEIADCIFLLMNLAFQYNLDLEKCLTNKLEDLRSR